MGTKTRLNSAEQRLDGALQDAIAQRRRLFYAIPLELCHALLRFRERVEADPHYIAADDELTAWRYALDSGALAAQDRENRLAGRYQDEPPLVEQISEYLQGYQECGR